MTTGKTIALTRQTFVGKVISLLLNMLSRLVITFLPRSQHLLISWLQSPSAVILEPQKIKVWHCFHCVPIYFPWSAGTRCHDIYLLLVLFFWRILTNVVALVLTICPFSLLPIPEKKKKIPLALPFDITFPDSLKNKPKWPILFCC